MESNGIKMLEMTSNTDRNSTIQAAFPMNNETTLPYLENINTGNNNKQQQNRNEEKELPKFSIISTPEPDTLSTAPLKMSSILEDENSNLSMESSEKSNFKLMNRFQTNIERSNVKRRNSNNKAKEMAYLLPTNSFERLNITK